MHRDDSKSKENDLEILDRGEIIQKVAVALGDTAVRDWRQKKDDFEGFAAKSCNSMTNRKIMKLHRLS